MKNSFIKIVILSTILTIVGVVSILNVQEETETMSPEMEQFYSTLDMAEYGAYCGNVTIEIVE